MVQAGRPRSSSSSAGGGGGFCFTTSRAATVLLVGCGIVAYLMNSSTKNMASYQQFNGILGQQPSSSSQLSDASYGGVAVEGDSKRFFELARRYGTDKVKGTINMPACLDDVGKCPRPDAENDACKVTGHFYDRIYDAWLSRYARHDHGPFQFLEIGYYNGRGFDAYTEYFSTNPNADLHSLEISCIEPGDRKDGKWPWGNFASKNSNYQTLLDDGRLHCGDASTYSFLHDTWTNKMRRRTSSSEEEPPPLMVVVEDASHLSIHMAISVFFWFPRIAPGGIMVVEDIESQTTANEFRTDFIPQLVMDLHYCGLQEESSRNRMCFPTLQPLLKSVTCEMHICVFERNDRPSVEYDEQDSMPPSHALDITQCREKKKRI